MIFIKQRFSLHDNAAGIRRLKPGENTQQRGFPDPEGPTIAVRLPGATLRFKLSSTCTSENDFEMAVNSSMS